MKNLAWFVAVILALVGGYWGGHLWTRHNCIVYVDALRAHYHLIPKLGL